MKVVPYLDNPCLNWDNSAPDLQRWGQDSSPILEKGISAAGRITVLFWTYNIPDWPRFGTSVPECVLKAALIVS